MLTVVTGPPCSGKTTHVRTHAQPGDIIIDFDNLAEALGSTVRHGHSPAHQQVTIAARSAAIEAAVRWHHKGATVWIVDCSVSPRRGQMYQKAGARFVTLSASEGELHRRANAERPRRWHKLIKDWQPPGQASSDITGSRSW